MGKYFSDCMNSILNPAIEILYGKITVGCYSKMFKTSFLRDNNIHFLEDVYIGEGFNFNVYAFCKAMNVAIRPT